VGGVSPAARPEGEESGLQPGREAGGAREGLARGPREAGLVLARREWERPKVGAALGLETEAGC
jgi:hypothetical protein